MLIKHEDEDAGTLRVTFQFPGVVWATTVHLVGDFNGWNECSLPLAHSRKDDPDWEITLDLPRGRAFQFRYLLNGATWCNDCNADAYVLNSYGGHNSVVQT